MNTAPSEIAANVDASGPDHEKLFRIEVWIDGQALGTGEGPSRRAAETAAALQALDAIRAARVAKNGGSGSDAETPAEAAG